MHYDKTMIAHIKEERLLEKAQRNPMVALVIMMNEYHALVHKYFPSEEIRQEQRKNLKDEIIRVGKKTPAPVRSKVKIWLNNPNLWYDDLDGFDFIR